MTTELATIDGEIIETRAPMTLFGTDDPTAVVERASAVATALASVIDERRLFASISGKKHVQVEGWTLLGSMLGVFAEVEWSRPLENGWEARAVARTLAGNVVGAAEAMCTASEGRWRSADTYAVRSMAQTRAVSKALRLPLGFIMHLAGYSATPAEELDTEQPDRGERTSRREAQPPSTSVAPAPVRTPEEKALIGQLLEIPGMTVARMSLLADAVGIPKGDQANAEQLRRMLVIAQEPIEQPSSVPAETDGEAVARAASPTTPQVGESLPVATGADSEVSGPPAPSGSGPAQPTWDDVLAATGGEEIHPAEEAAIFAANLEKPRSTEEAIAAAAAKGRKAKVG